MRSRWQWLEDLGTHAALIFMSLLILFPVLVMLSTSLKPENEIFLFPPRLLPSRLYLDNFVQAWERNPFGRFLANSLIVSGLITAGQLIFSCLAAFAFSRLKFWGRDLFFFLFLATLMVPGEVTIIPNFFTISKLGWVNSYYALTVPFLASAFGTFLLRQFFLTIPQELEDAAKIDGCGKLRFLITILLPLSRPALGALGIFSFLTAWNMYLWPLIVTNKTSMRTVQIGIALFLQQTEGISWGVVMAGTVMIVFPTILAFLIAQKQFVRGIALTGLKG